jgi:flagellar biosynthesis/type III secretory pathway chaperone
MRSTEIPTELLSHLDAEVACLAELEACLLDEQSALRRLEVDSLVAIAARKGAIVEQQSFLSSRRARLLAQAP